MSMAGIMYKANVMKALWPMLKERYEGMFRDAVKNSSNVAFWESMCDPSLPMKEPLPNFYIHRPSLFGNFRIRR